MEPLILPTATSSVCGLGRVRRRPLWSPDDGRDSNDALRRLPTVSPFRPRPVGPYYPLQVRDLSRVALRVVRSTSDSNQTAAASSTRAAQVQVQGECKHAVEIAAMMIVGVDTPHKNNNNNSSSQNVCGGEGGSNDNSVGATTGTFKRPAPIVPIGTRYTLTRDEMRECVRIGRERNQRNRSEGRLNRRYASHRTDDDISVQGVIGELAFARLFDLSIDIHDTTCRSARTEVRFDAIMPPYGWTVDVKTMIGRDGPLRVNHWKLPNPPDLYALLVYTNYDAEKPLDAQVAAMPIIEFRGFASSATVFCSSNRVDTVDRDGQRGVLYVVQQQSLVDRAAIEAQALHGGKLRHSAET